MRKIPDKGKSKDFAGAFSSATLALMQILALDLVDARILVWCHRKVSSKERREVDEKENIWALVNHGAPIEIQKLINGLYVDEKEFNSFKKQLIKFGFPPGQAEKIIENYCNTLEQESTVEKIMERLNRLNRVQMLLVMPVRENVVKLKLNQKYIHPDYVKETLDHWKD